MAMRFLCAMRMRDDHKPHWFYLGRTRNDYRIAKLRLHRILDEPGSSAAAFWYNWFITLIVFIGYGISVLEITRDANLESAPYNGYFYPRTYQVALYPVLGLSAVDIVLRLLCSDKWFVPCECRAEHHHGEGCLSERPFFIQVYTWLDILALLGGFLGLGCFASALRFIRLAKHNRSFQIVVQVLSDSWADLKFSLFLLLVVLGFFACILLAIESPYDKDAEFVDLYSALYYCFITFSSVGFGDMVSDRTIGRAVAGLLMVSGTFFLALPLTVIGNNFEKAWEKHMSGRIAQIDSKNGNDELKKHHLEKAEQSMSERNHQQRTLLRAMQVQDCLRSCEIHFESLRQRQHNSLLGLKYALERLFLRSGQLAGHLLYLSKVPKPVRVVLASGGGAVVGRKKGEVKAEKEGSSLAEFKVDSARPDDAVVSLAKIGVRIKTPGSADSTATSIMGQSIYPGGINPMNESSLGEVLAARDALGRQITTTLATSGGFSDDVAAMPPSPRTSDVDESEEKTTARLSRSLLHGVDFRDAFLNGNKNKTTVVPATAPVWASPDPALHEIIGDAHRYDLEKKRSPMLKHSLSMALVPTPTKAASTTETPKGKTKKTTAQNAPPVSAIIPMTQDGLRLLGFFWAAPALAKPASVIEGKGMAATLKRRMRGLRRASTTSKGSLIQNSMAALVPTVSGNSNSHINSDSPQKKTSRSSSWFWTRSSPTSGDEKSEQTLSYLGAVCTCWRRCWCRSVAESLRDEKLVGQWIDTCHAEGGWRNWLYLLFEARNEGYLFESNIVYIFRTGQLVLLLAAMVLMGVETIPGMNAYGQNAAVCKAIVKSYCATIDSCSGMHDAADNVGGPLVDPWCSMPRISAPSFNSTLLMFANPGCFPDNSTGYGGCLPGTTCDWPRHDLGMECNSTFEPFGRTWLDQVMHEPKETSNKYVCDRLQCRDGVSDDPNGEMERVFFVLECIATSLFTVELGLRLMGHCAPKDPRARLFFCSDWGAWLHVGSVILGITELISAAVHRGEAKYSPFGYFGWSNNSFVVNGWSDVAQFRITHAILVGRLLVTVAQWETVSVIVMTFRKSWRRLVIPVFFFFVMAVVFGGALTMVEQGTLWRCEDWENASEEVCKSCYGPPVMTQPLAHWALRLIGWEGGNVPAFSVDLTHPYLGHNEW